MSTIKSVKITNWKNATQMASRVNDHETGFADIVIGKGENYVDLDTSHYYIVMIMSGEVSVSCKLYHNLKSATKLFSVLLASKRPLITELADKLRLKYPLLPTISPCPTMRLEAIRSIIPISCRRYPKSV